MSAHSPLESTAASFRLAAWAGAAVLMVVPILFVRGVDGAAWDVPGDLMFLAVLLAGLGAAFEIATRVPARRAYGAAVGYAIAAGVLGVWINLAVGILGNEDNPANLLFGIPPLVAAVGACATRLRAAGMARTMVAAAAAQGLAFLVAMVVGLGFTGPISTFFCGLWLISAWLFRRSDQARAAAVA